MFAVNLRQVVGVPGHRVFHVANQNLRTPSLPDGFTLFLRSSVERTLHVLLLTGYLEIRFVTC